MRMGVYSHGVSGLGLTPDRVLSAQGGAFSTDSGLDLNTDALNINVDNATDQQILAANNAIAKQACIDAGGLWNPGTNACSGGYNAAVCYPRSFIGPLQPSASYCDAVGGGMVTGGGVNPALGVNTPKPATPSNLNYYLLGAVLLGFVFIGGRK